VKKESIHRKGGVGVAKMLPVQLYSIIGLHAAQVWKGKVRGY